MIDFKKIEEFLLSPLFIGGALLAISVQLCLTAQRLRLLLRPLGVRLSYWTMLRLTYLGAAFDVFLVTSVGGDAIKAVYLAREAPPGKRLEAVSVLLLDRLLGLLGLLSLTLLASLLALNHLWGDPKLRQIFLGLVGVSVFLIFGLLALVSRRIYESPPLQWLVRHLPVGGLLARAYGALQQFGNHPRTLLYGWLFSLGVHAVGIVTGYLLAVGVKMDGLALEAFPVPWLISNFACSFAPLSAIGVGQVAYGEAFTAIAAIGGGANLATALQLVTLLAKSPGLLAWLASREQLAPQAPAAEQALEEAP